MNTAAGFFGDFWLGSQHTGDKFVQLAFGQRLDVDLLCTKNTHDHLLGQLVSFLVNRIDRSTLGTNRELISLLKFRKFFFQFSNDLGRQEAVNCMGINSFLDFASKVIAEIFAKCLVQSLGFAFGQCDVASNIAGSM